MQATAEKRFYVCQHTTSGEQFWLVRNSSGQMFWLKEDDFERSGITDLETVSESELQELSKQHERLQAWDASHVNQSKPASQPTMKTEPKRQSPFKFKRTEGRSPDHPRNDIEQPWQGAIAPWVNLLYILLAIAVFFVCLWNIGPYEVAVRYVASKFETSALVSFLLWMPVVGWILQGIGNFIFWLVGALVWGCIQLIELMPLIMTNHPGYVRSVLVQQEAHTRVRVRHDDPGIVRYLKKFYNHLPVRFLVLARRLRGWVYVLDMMIVMMVYPPVREGGIARFFFLLMTGQWGQLDWPNIVLMFVTLLAVEAVVKILLIVNHFRLYLRTAKDEQQPIAA